MRNGLLLMVLLLMPACQPFLARKSAPVPTPPPLSEFGTLSPGQSVRATPLPPAVPGLEPTLPLVPAPTQPIATQVTYASPEMLFPDQPVRGPRPESPVIAAMQAHLDGRYAATVGHLAGFGKRNQDLLLLLLPIVDSARTVDLDVPSPKLAGLMRQLDTVSEMVARSAPLGLRTMTFVKTVTKYGVFEPLPAPHTFPPSGFAMLYVEVANAPSVPAVFANHDTGYVTRLAWSLELMDANNRLVELLNRETNRPVNELPIVQHEFTRSPIRDHFLKIEFLVPEKPGKYTLRVEVKDTDGSRRVGKEIVFQVRES